MRQSKHIYIVGYMSSGKSLIGEALAEKINHPFIDLDDHLEETSGKWIQRIFEEIGEEGFRHMEAYALRSLPKNRSHVIACGGGTPCFFNNMDWMLGYGKVIYLKASPEVLSERLSDPSLRMARPLLAKYKNKSEIERAVSQQLSRRAVHYERAHHIINIDSFADRIDDLVQAVSDLV